jgi:hypothetical protein
MRPTVSEQLDAVRNALADVVGPEVSDAYAADVLAGALATLERIADTWADVPSFLRWDCEATSDVLRLVDVDVPPMPDDLLDVEALHAHDRDLRALLVTAMPAVLERDDARTAVVQLFRDRAARYPSAAARPGGGTPAHAAR